MVRLALSALLLLGLVAGPSQAFEPSRIIIKVGYPPGAAFDVVARAAANRLGAYLPGNPTIIVENVEGAGSRRLLNLLVHTGVRDGTEIAFIDPGIALDPILNPAMAEFDPRNFNYVVSFSNTPTYCMATVASGIGDLDSLLSRPVTMGAIGRGQTYFAPAAIERALGADFNIITGFAGVAEVILAMARGEVDALCGITSNSFEQMRAAMDFTVIAELSPRPFGLIEGAEFVLDRVGDPTARAALSLVFSPSLVWFPAIVHPDTPAETVAILRDAFAMLAADQGFLDEVRTRGVEISLTHGAEVQTLIAGFLDAGPDVVAAARALIE